MGAPVELLVAVALLIPACLLLVAIVASLRALPEEHVRERDR